MVRFSLVLALIASVFVGVLNVDASLQIFVNKVLLAFIIFFALGFVLYLTFMIFIIKHNKEDQIDEIQKQAQGTKDEESDE